METKHENNTTSKKQKVQVEGEMVNMIETKGKKNKMKVKGIDFEIKDYALWETPEESTSQFKARVDLFDKYRDDKEVSTNESLKLYVDVRKMSSKDVSLVIVRDHVWNTLNLSVATQNKVDDMRMNIENIHVPYMIYLHKKTAEVIYNDLLKATLKVSRLQSTKSKVENQLR